MIELMLLKKLMLAKQVYQKSAIFVTIGNFWIIGLSFNHIYVMAAMMY